MSLSANAVDSGPAQRNAASSASSVAAPLCAALLGLVLLYGVGFAQTEALHNGAHDARHAAGFACH